MQLSIITVNTNEWRVIKPCLESVFRETAGMECEMIVVDNNSHDGSREHLAREFPAVRVLHNPVNLGFAASNNRGIQIARGHYVLLLNPDTVIQPGALRTTVGFMDMHPGVGIAGCTLFLADGSTQQSVRSFPSVWNVLCETFFLTTLIPRSRLFGRYYLTDFDFATSSQVDWLCGAYFLIRRAVIEKIGLLDEQFYMYTEEMDYCRRARDEGWTTWYVADAAVVHYWGGVSAFTKRVIVWSNGSQIIYFRKHFHGLERMMLVGLKCLGLLNRSLVYALLGVVTLRKRLLQKSWYHAVAFGRILTEDWSYREGFKGPVEPWKP